MKVAFFDTKNYDITSFEPYAKEKEIKLKFYETKLNEDTVDLAKGCFAVCAFVNDVINAEVIDRLCELDVKLLAMRCAGYNNVDINYAKGKIDIVRVPAYSPYAVAEHAKPDKAQECSWAPRVT